MSDPPILLLDACVVINICATGHHDSILSSPEWDFHIATRVQSETQGLHFGESINETDSPVDLMPLYKDGVITEWALASDREFQDYIDFALQVDEGEAMTIALAVSRGAAVATDDRKAKRLLDALGIGSVSSLELLMKWSDSFNVSEEQMIAVRERVTKFGRYCPRKDDQFADWWFSIGSD